MTLQHVSLELRRADVPAELRFWALLGFAEVEPPGTLGEIAAWAQRDGTQIHLRFDDDPVIPPGGHVELMAAPAPAGRRRARPRAVASRVVAVPSYSRPHPCPALARTPIMLLWPPPPSPAPLSCSPPPSSRAATHISASATSFAPA